MQRDSRPATRTHQEGGQADYSLSSTRNQGGTAIMKAQSERKQLIAAILPLLERMPMDWLRATYIMAQKWADRTK